MSQHETEKPHSRLRACGRSASRSASRASSSGSIVSWPAVAVGAVIAVGLRLPLDPRPDERRPRAGSARSSRSAAVRRRGRSAGRPRTSDAGARRGARDVPAQQRSSRRHARPRRRDRRHRHRAGARLRRRSRRSRTRQAGRRPRPARELPRGQVRDRHLPRGARAARSRGGRCSSATTAASTDSRASRSSLPLRPPRLPGAAERAGRGRRQADGRRERRRCSRPTQPSGFGCPCHGGPYDTEGNRTAGPPVRALDRSEFAINDGNLLLVSRSASAEVEGTGADARINKYEPREPGRPRRRP